MAKRIKRQPKRIKRQPMIPRLTSPMVQDQLMALRDMTVANAAEIVRLAKQQQAHDVEALRRTAESLRQVHHQMAELERKLNQIDGREARLSGAIEQAVQASQVLSRVERGLRPMLVQALNNDQRANWLDESYASALELYASASS